MQEYKAYVIGADGHVADRIDLVCVTEQVARDRAKQLADGHDVELWQEGRRVATFKHEK
jgi:hypothetical protein